jgi:hypothetical protein
MAITVFSHWGCNTQLKSGALFKTETDAPALRFGNNLALKQ